MHIFFTKPSKLAKLFFIFKLHWATIGFCSLQEFPVFLLFQISETFSIKEKFEFHNTLNKKIKENTDNYLEKLPNKRSFSKKSSKYLSNVRYLCFNFGINQGIDKKFFNTVKAIFSFSHYYQIPLDITFYLPKDFLHQARKDQNVWDLTDYSVNPKNFFKIKSLGSKENEPIFPFNTYNINLISFITEEWFNPAQLPYITGITINMDNNFFESNTSTSVEKGKNPLKSSDGLKNQLRLSPDFKSKFQRLLPYVEKLCLENTKLDQESGNNQFNISCFDLEKVRNKVLRNIDLTLPFFPNINNLFSAISGNNLIHFEVDTLILPPSLNESFQNIFYNSTNLRKVILSNVKKSLIQYSIPSISKLQYLEELSLSVTHEKPEDESIFNEHFFENLTQLKKLNLPNWIINSNALTLLSNLKCLQSLKIGFDFSNTTVKDHEIFAQCMKNFHHLSFYSIEKLENTNNSVPLPSLENSQNQTATKNLIRDIFENKIKNFVSIMDLYKKWASQSTSIKSVLKFDFKNNFLNLQNDKEFYYKLVQEGKILCNRLNRKYGNAQLFEITFQDSLS